jgi:hypothetical protein
MVALAQSVAPETSYDVSGSLHRQIFVDGQVHYSATNSFEVQVRGSSVRIYTWNVSINGALKVKSYEFFSDGNISYFITMFDIDSKTVEESQASPAKLFSSFVDIYTNQFAPNNVGYMGPIWIATASSRILNIEGIDGGEIYPEIFMCPDWPDIGGEKIKAAWSMSSITPHLPEQLVEYADSETFTNVNNFYKRWKGKEFPSTYAMGYTNALFKVLNWTNSSGLQLPQHFQIIGYIPDYNGEAPNQLQIQFVCDGFIETVDTTNLNSIIFPKQFPGWSQIYEYRFGAVKGEPVVYTSKSGSLLSKDEVLGLAHQYNQVVDDFDNAKEKHRKIIILCMSITLIVPIFFLLYRNFRIYRKE